MKLIHKSMVVVLLAVLAACSDKETPVTQTAKQEVTTESVTDSAQPAADTVPAAKPTAIFLRYDVHEPDVAPYQTRIVITDDYMRIDDDDNPLNFVLMDRRKQVVYSVSDDNKEILVVPEQSIDLLQPFEIKYTEQRVVDKQAPTIDDKPTARYIFEANGRACYDTVIAEGLLPQATKALTQYLGILAGQHAATLKRVPADVINACDLGMNVFKPGMHLVHGLPISEHDPASGYQRQLIEFDDEYEVDPGLFVLPEAFGRYAVSDLQNDGMPAQSGQ